MFRKLRLLCNHINCDYEIIYNGFSWVSDGRRPYVIIRKKAKNKYISTYRPFSSALKKSIETKKNCIICRYSSFIAFGKKLDFTLICTAKIVGENAVEFSLKAENETGYEIQAVYFPAPFNSKHSLIFTAPFPYRQKQGRRSPKKCPCGAPWLMLTRRTGFLLPLS